MENYSGNYSQEFIEQLNKPDKSSGLSKPMKIVLIALGVISFIVLILFLINIISKNSESTLTHSLQTNLEYELKIIEEYHPKLENTNLRSANSSLKIVLTNFNRDLKKFDKIVPDPKAKTNTNTVSDDKLSASLNNALLNAMLDRTYIQEMKFEIEKIMISTNKLYNKSNSRNLKDALKTNYDSLKAIRDQLEAMRL